MTKMLVVLAAAAALPVLVQASDSTVKTAAELAAEAARAKANSAAESAADTAEAKAKAATDSAAKSAVDKMKSVSEGNVTRVRGTIEAISPTTREVTVNVGGQLHTFAVKPDVKRFNELKVGDTLTAAYHESVLMEVRKPGAEKPQAAAGGDVMRVPGQAVRPSGAMVAQQVATVQVKAIDKKTPAITVVTDDDRVVTMKVKHPERLEAVAVGDKIDVTYTEALIVNIE